MEYRVVRGHVEVKSRSTAGDTTTRFPKLEGTIDFDPDATAGARVDLTVDMRVFDAGDRLKNWKLGVDLEADQHPTATFTLARFTDIHEPTSGQFTATALGQISWRGHAPFVTVKGVASADRRSVDARASFDLDLRELGIAPPKFLMFRSEDVVRIQVTLFAVIVER